MTLGVVMSTRLDELAKILLSVSRKRLLRKSPVFKPHRKIFADSLDTLERKIGIPIPDDLRDCLFAIGYGDIGEEISFREEMVCRDRVWPTEGRRNICAGYFGEFLCI